MELIAAIKSFGQRELADALGVTVGMISHVVTGRRSFSVSVARRAAEVLGLPLSKVRPDIWGDE